MKHFELGQRHKVDINEGFKEIKTAPEYGAGPEEP